VLRLEAYDKADRTTKDESQTSAYRKVRGIETTDENDATQAIMFQLQTLRTELQGEMSAVGQRLQKLETLCTTQPAEIPFLSNTKSEFSHVAARQTGVGNRTYTKSSTPSASNNSRRRPRQCFTCGLTTHLAADCHNKVVSSSNDTSTSSVPHVKTIKDGKLLDVNYLTITINGQSEPCLIDTGCQVSLVPTRMVPNGTLQPAPTQLEAANGTPISVIGKLSTGILLNGFCTHADLLVSPDIDEAMIGMDFLSLYECQLNFLSHTLIIDGRKLQLFQCDAKSRCRRVLLTETVTLPPLSQTILTVTATFKNLMQTHSEFLLESHQIGSDLTVARTLVPSRCSKVATCILNTSAEPQVLPEGSCLGYLESVEVCSKRPTLSCAVVTQPSISQSSRQTVHKHEERIAKVRPIILEMTQRLSNELNAEQQGTVENLLWNYQDILSVDDFDLGYTDLVSHTIDTGDSPPLRETLRRHPPAYLDAIDKQVGQMLQQNDIEPASSHRCSNVVLVRKKDNSLRVAIDYRRLNNVTRKDSYPLPRIDSCLDALNGSSWFSTLDLRAGYWQVRQDPKDADKTAFITRKGCYRFKVLSFGLTRAPSLFQRLMDLVLAGLTLVHSLGLS
jgi:Reverse transcriptase (RNA-dependent DNA polymerase)